VISALSSEQAASANPQVWFPDTSALVTLAVHLPLQQAVVATLSAHYRRLLQAVVTELEELAATSDITATWAGTALGQLAWLGESVPLDDPAGVELAVRAARGDRWRPTAEALYGALRRGRCDLSSMSCPESEAADALR
jgi:hypothetical protein